MAEVNTALAMEVDGAKTVVPLMVGRRICRKLPLIAAKNQVVWNGDAMAVALRLQKAVKRHAKGVEVAPATTPATVPLMAVRSSVPSVPSTKAVGIVRPARGWLTRLFGRRP